jgi:hypothetical protein
MISVHHLTQTFLDYHLLFEWHILDDRVTRQANNSLNQPKQSLDVYQDLEKYFQREYTLGAVTLLNLKSLFWLVTLTTAVMF